MKGRARKKRESQDIQKEKNNDREFERDIFLKKKKCYKTLFKVIYIKFIVSG